MAIRNFLKDDLRFILFSEIYLFTTSAKAKRKALNIVETAIDVIAVHGMKKSTLAMVAKRSKMSESSILYYFSSFQNLQIFCLKYSRVLYQKYVISNVTKSQNPIKMFELYFDSCLLWPRYFPKHKALWIDLFHQTLTSKKMRAFSTEMVTVGFERLHELIRLGHESGHFHSTNSLQTARTIHILITGLLLSEATEENELIEQQNEIIKSQCFQILGISKNNPQA